MINAYRKKPVEIQAVEYNGSNAEEIKEFCGDSFENVMPGSLKITIKTLEGNITADIGDYIIKGIAGEFYPCKPDIFLKTYEEV
ncbi:MAG: hypothetical protein ACRC92_27250 [Peptostreptococcaceae bacterium]